MIGGAFAGTPAVRDRHRRPGEPGFVAAHSARPPGRRSRHRLVHLQRPRSHRRQRSRRRRRSCGRPDGRRGLVPYDRPGDRSGRRHLRQRQRRRSRHRVQSDVHRRRRRRQRVSSSRRTCCCSPTVPLPIRGTARSTSRSGWRIVVTYQDETGGSPDANKLRVNSALVDCATQILAGGVVWATFGRDAFSLVSGGCEKDARGFFTFGFPDKYMDEGELIDYRLAFQSTEIGPTSKTCGSRSSRSRSMATARRRACRDRRTAPIPTAPTTRSART